MFKYLITASAIIALLLTTASGKPAVPTIRVISNFPIADDDTLDSPMDEVPVTTTKYENDLGFSDDTDAKQTEEETTKPWFLDSFTEAPETESKADDDDDSGDSFETGTGINDSDELLAEGKERPTAPQHQEDELTTWMNFLASLYLTDEVETMKSQTRLNEIVNEGYMKCLEIQLNFNNQMMKTIISIHRALDRVVTNNLILAGIIVLLMILSVLQGCRLSSLEKQVREMKRALKTDSDSSYNKEVLVKV